MTRMIVAFALVALLTAASGCGGSEESSTAAPAETDRSSALERAEALPSTPAESHVAACLRLTESEEWAAAVAPCTRAAKQRPDDLKIRHALQQAQAGAAAALRS